MSTDEARRMLAPLATVVRRGQEYRATLTETGAVITFRDQQGQVAGVRVARHDSRPWACRTLRKAIAHGLTRGRAIAGGNHILGVCLARRGGRFTPVASFLLTDFTNGAENLTGAAVEWTDGDAIGMAEAIIAGQVTIPVALEWLRARGVEVA